MNVLHLTGRSDHGGGPEHVLQLVTATAGWVDSRIACPRQGVYWSRYADLVGEDRLLPIPHRRVDLETLVRLRGLLRESPVDLLHSHGMAAGVTGRLLAGLTGIPCVHTFHGVPVTTSPKHALYRLVEPLLSRLTALGIAVSPGEQAVILDRYRGYAGRLVMVSNGIAVEDQPLPVRTGGADLRVAMFARHNRQKRPELVTAIAERLVDAGPSIRFDLYGEGLAQASWARKAAPRLAVRCHPPSDDPQGLLDRADVYLSTSRWEGMPLALIEAFRSGAVVVASDVVGNRDVVQHGRNGLLFPEGDADAAAAAIRRLSAAPALRERLRLQARRDCLERHTRELMAMRVLGCYRTVLEGLGRPVDVLADIPLVALAEGNGAVVAPAAPRAGLVPG